MNAVQAPRTTSARKSWNLNKVPKKKRLTIRYLRENNIFMAKGRSTGLELLPVYNRIILKLKAHLNHSEKLSCYFDYSVINATTTKLLCNLFSNLEKAASGGKTISVYWMIEEEDEDLIYAGELFQEIYDINFKIVSK